MLPGLIVRPFFHPRLFFREMDGDLPESEEVGSREDQRRGIARWIRIL